MWYTLMMKYTGDGINTSCRVTPFCKKGWRADLRE